MEILVLEYEKSIFGLHFAILAFGSLKIDLLIEIEGLNGDLTFKVNLDLWCDIRTDIRSWNMKNRFLAFILLFWPLEAPNEVISYISTIWMRIWPLRSTLTFDVTAEWIYGLGIWKIDFLAFISPFRPLEALKLNVYTDPIGKNCLKWKSERDFPNGVSRRQCPIGKNTNKHGDR